MDRVFLDANVLYSSAYLTSSSFRLLWKMKGITLLTSAYAVEEVTRNLAQDHPEKSKELKKLLEAVEVVVDPLGLTLPSSAKLAIKDQPVLLAAIHAKATHLLTGDGTHFRALYGKTIGRVLILTPADYWARRLK